MRGHLLGWWEVTLSKRTGADLAECPVNPSSQPIMTRSRHDSSCWLHSQHKSGLLCTQLIFRGRGTTDK